MGAFTVPFRVLSRKQYDRRWCVISELVLLKSEKHVKPRPQKRILLPLKGSFQNFRRALPSFLYESPTPGRLCTNINFKGRVRHMSVLFIRLYYFIPWTERIIEFKQSLQSYSPIFFKPGLTLLSGQNERVMLRYILGSFIWKIFIQPQYNNRKISEFKGRI